MRFIIFTLLSVPFMSYGQAASKDTVAVTLAPANAATIALNNAYKSTFTLLNNQIAISSKRSDSMIAAQAKLIVALQRQHFVDSVNYKKQQRSDSLALEAVKKIANTALTNSTQYSRLTAAKGGVKISIVTPGNYLIDIDPALKARIAALEAKLSTGSGGADKTITIQIK